MPRPRFPYLHREVTRHRKTVWYYRNGSAPRVRIDGDYNSPDFLTAYHAAAQGAPVDRRVTRVAPRKTNGKESMVYFILSGDLVKIGISSNPEKRLKELATGNASRLRLLKVVPGGITYEREMHRQFSELRVRGEWFEYKEPLKAFISGVQPSSVEGEIIL